MRPNVEPSAKPDTEGSVNNAADPESCATMHDLPDQVFDQVWSMLGRQARVKLFALSKVVRDQVLRCTDKLTVLPALDPKGQLHGAQLMHAAASRAGRHLNMALKGMDIDSFKGLAACIQLGADMNLLHGQPWSAVARLELEGITGRDGMNPAAVAEHFPAAFPALRTLAIRRVSGNTLQDLTTLVSHCQQLHSLELDDGHIKVNINREPSKELPFSDAQLSFSRDLPHAVSKLTQLRSLSINTNVLPKQLKLLAALTNLERLSIKGKGLWHRCRGTGTEAEFDRQYEANTLLPAVAKMKSLRELHFNLMSDPSVMHAKPVLKALQAHGGALRVLHMPRQMLDTAMLDAVLTGAPQLEELTVNSILPDESRADAPCRWRKLTLFCGSMGSLNARTLAFTPLHSLEQPLLVVDPMQLNASNARINPTSTFNSSGGTAQELAWVEAAVANLARLKPGMLLRPYDPEEDEPRSFELHGFCHPNSLPLLLDGITTALQRAGPGKGFPQMDAIKLDFVKISEGTLPALGRVWGDGLTRLRITTCHLPPFIWDQLLECLPRMDTLVLKETSLYGLLGPADLARFCAAAARSFTLVVMGGVMWKNDIPVLRAKLRELGVSDTHPVRLLLSCEHEVEDLPGVRSDKDGFSDISWQADEDEEEEDGDDRWAAYYNSSDEYEWDE